ncbi:hypothetical protein [Desulfococcus sp.]|uniref:hypothetical protein n=1 Tax=Desulfococcus sp. TaxID=2025834 RepID=UPI003593E6B2
MAANFRIVSQKNRGDLHIRLTGDFDGSSACELVNALEACDESGGKIVIDTCGLLSIHPFGKGVFQKYCAVKKLPLNITFTGKYGSTIKPQPGLSL